MVIFYCVPKLIYSLGAATDVNQDYKVEPGVSNQTGGQDVQDQMKEMNQDEMKQWHKIQKLASLFQSKLKSDGGVSRQELVHSHWSRTSEARLSLVESVPSDACASRFMP